MKLGGVAAEASRVRNAAYAGSDRLQFVAPPRASQAGKADVVAVTASGIETEPYPVEIADGPRPARTPLAGAALARSDGEQALRGRSNGVTPSTGVRSALLTLVRLNR